MTSRAGVGSRLFVWYTLGIFLSFSEESRGVFGVAHFSFSHAYMHFSCGMTSHAQLRSWLGRMDLEAFFFSSCAHSHRGILLSIICLMASSFVFTHWYLRSFAHLCTFATLHYAGNTPGSARWDWRRQVGDLRVYV
jgi:hypothetical protein